MFSAKVLQKIQHGNQSFNILHLCCIVNLYLEQSYILESLTCKLHQYKLAIGLVSSTNLSSTRRTRSWMSNPLHSTFNHFSFELFFKIHFHNLILNMFTLSFSATWSPSLSSRDRDVIGNGSLMDVIFYSVLACIIETSCVWLSLMDGILYSTWQRWLLAKRKIT